MKRLLLLLLMLAALSAGVAEAQNERENIFSTKAIRNMGLGLTASGSFGLPRYTTALLPTCDAFNAGAVVFDTTTGTAKTCNGTTWASMGEAPPFADTSAIVKGSVDATKLLRFEVDGFTAGATRVITFPDADATVFTLGGTQTATGTKTFSGSVTLDNTNNFLQTDDLLHLGDTSANTAPGIALDSEHTPDSPSLYTGSTSNSWHIQEKSDGTFDFQNCSAGTSASTDPVLCIHSRNQSTTEYIEAKHDGSNGVITTGAGELALAPAGGVRLNTNKYIYSQSAGAANAVIYGLASSTSEGMFQANGGTAFASGGFVRLQMENTAKALTAGAATAVVQIPLAAETRTGGSIEYTVDATDATDHQSRAGKVFFQVVNKAGTETCVVSGTAGNVNPTEAQDGSAPAASAGTLTYTWGVDTTGANACNITLNAVSSLVETVLQITYTVFKNGGLGAITPQ